MEREDAQASALKGYVEVPRMLACTYFGDEQATRNLLQEIWDNFGMHWTEMVAPDIVEMAGGQDVVMRGANKGLVLFVRRDPREPGKIKEVKPIYFRPTISDREPSQMASC